MPKPTRISIRPERGGIRVTIYAAGARGARRRLSTRLYARDKWKAAMLDPAEQRHLGIGPKKP